jgi:uncharacterized protein
MPTSSYVTPILLLVASNVFMTFAWYGHLKFKTSPLWIAIAVSWGIALIEYCLAVPANRFGSAVYSTAQLKTMQEIITLAIFAGFSVFWLGEQLTLNHVVGFALIAAGAWFIFAGPLK